MHQLAVSRRPISYVAQIGVLAAIYFFAVFKNRVAKISVDTLLAADELVRRIVQQAKSMGATPAAVEPPVPARV